MRENGRTAKTIRNAAVLLALTGLVLGAVSCRTGAPLAAFLGGIDDYGGTTAEMEQLLGEPDATSRNATGPFVTVFYYPGLTAQFDDYTGRISVLVISDGRWTADGVVRIGGTKDEVAEALGDGYVRLMDGGRDVWVYLCPRSSSDAEAARCDYCRVCYISFEDGRVSMIEWSAELLGGYLE